MEALQIVPWPSALLMGSSLPGVPPTLHFPGDTAPLPTPSPFKTQLQVPPPHTLFSRCARRLGLSLQLCILLQQPRLCECLEDGRAGDGARLGSGGSESLWLVWRPGPGPDHGLLQERQGWPSPGGGMLLSETHPVGIPAERDMCQGLGIMPAPPGWVLLTSPS